MNISHIKYINLILRKKLKKIQKLNFFIKKLISYKMKYFNSKNKKNKQIGYKFKTFQNLFLHQN